MSAQMEDSLTYSNYSPSRAYTLSVLATAHAVGTLIQETKHAFTEPPAPLFFISTKLPLISCSKYPTASHGSVEPLQLFCCMMLVMKSMNDRLSLSASCNKKNESGSISNFYARWFNPVWWYKNSGIQTRSQGSS